MRGLGAFPKPDGWYNPTSMSWVIPGVPSQLNLLVKPPQADPGQMHLNWLHSTYSILSKSLSDYQTSHAIFKRPDTLHRKLISAAWIWRPRAHDRSWRCKLISTSKLRARFFHHHSKPLLTQHGSTCPKFNFFKKMYLSKKVPAQ